jgi:2,3-bisphosphoglycerate-dependent phosphoglycerate mutase
VQLYFIRHAQSANNHLWDTTQSSSGRSEDPELTEVGRRQAEILARFLAQSNPNAIVRGHDEQNRAGFGITHIYSSLMMRAVATGTTVAHTLGLQLVGWQDLHEWGGIYLQDETTGEYNGLPGKTRSYFQARYPNLILPDSVDEEGWWKRRPHEEEEQVVVRAERAWNELAARHGETQDHVAIVSHGAFFNVFMRFVFKMQMRLDDFWLAMNNAAITRIDLVPNQVVMVYANRIDYMPKELIT